jgi:excisionase family DNA binding protein
LALQERAERANRATRRKKRAQKVYLGQLGRRFAYTIAELKQLGLGGPTFIYKGIAAGRLRAVKKGRHTVILEPDLHAWMRCLPPTEVWQPTPTPQPDLKRRVRHLASIEAPGDRRHYRVIPGTLASKRRSQATATQALLADGQKYFLAIKYNKNN